MEELLEAGQEYKCKRCGKQWHSRKPGLPTCCGVCKSAYWDRDRLILSRAPKRRRRVSKS